jgi:hypothetical protein
VAEAASTMPWTVPPPRGGGLREHRLRERDEGRVLGDEVGLGVDLDHDAGLAGTVRTDVDDHDPVGGVAPLALGNALQTLDPEDLDSLVLVAVRLVESPLHVEHARAGPLAERLDICGGEVRHEACPFVSLDRSE